MMAVVDAAVATDVADMTLGLLLASEAAARV
jgi:hypothetical protein